MQGSTLLSSPEPFLDREGRSLGNGGALRARRDKKHSTQLMLRQQEWLTQAYERRWSRPECPIEDRGRRTSGSKCCSTAADAARKRSAINRMHCCCNGATVGSLW